MIGMCVCVMSKNSYFLTNPLRIPNTCRYMALNPAKQLKPLCNARTTDVHTVFVILADYMNYVNTFLNV